MFKHRIVYNFLPKCTRFYSAINNLSVFSIYETKSTGNRVKVQGWVKSLRKMKENLFFDLSDGSCDKKLQVLIPSEQKPPGLSTGASVKVDGFLSFSPKGQLEIQAENVEVYGKCEMTDGYPFLPRKTYSPEYVRQYLHFRPRTNKFASLLRVRDSLLTSIHSYFHDEGYIHIHTPVLTSNDCEGAGEVFTVIPENKETLKGMISPGTSPEETYFNSKVFLTVSGQLHLEAAVHGLTKVYTLGPTFRAENSKSRLHLSEFYMLEAECAFLERIEQLTGIIEKLVKTVTAKILSTCAEDIERCKEKSLDFAWLENKFAVLTYDEAVSILNQNTDRFNGRFVAEKGLTKEHEHFLVNHCNAPTFIINWPRDLKPFYMKNCPDGETKVAALDLLVPIVGELVGGSLRENNYKELQERLPKNKGELDWYLDIRKFGGVPTGGFGLGFERYLQLILGISNIKDTIPFPRWPHNCKL